MSEIVDKWRSLQKGPRVPRPSTPPKTPRYDVRGIQSLTPINERRRLTTQDVAGTYPSLVAKRPELLARLAKRGSTYDVRAIQGGAPARQRTPRQRRAIENKAAIATAYNQNIESMLQFGIRYVTGMTAFNALPGVVSALTNRPLQAMVTHGPPALQKFILQGLGPKLGPGAARLVDTMIQRGTGPLAAVGLAERFFGSLSVANIPENRPSRWR